MTCPSFHRKGLASTSILKHENDVGDSKTIKQKYYSVSPAVQAELYDNIDEMLRLGVINESSSAWCSPVVIIRKPNDKKFAIVSVEKFGPYIGSCIFSDHRPCESQVAHVPEKPNWTLGPLVTKVTSFRFYYTTCERFRKCGARCTYTDVHINSRCNLS